MLFTVSFINLGDFVGCIMEEEDDLTTEVDVLEEQENHVDEEEIFDEKSPLDFFDGSVVRMKTQCPECGKYLANVNEHIKLVHLKIRNHACSDCVYRSCFKNDMEKHMQAVHGKSSYFHGKFKNARSENTVQNKSPWFMSPNKNFESGKDIVVADISAVEGKEKSSGSNETNVEVGISNSTGVKLEDLLDKPSYIGIEKVHTDAKTTQCPHCDKFLTNIKEHIKAVHMKEKNYFCNICDYKTLFKSDLIKHDDLVHRKLKKTCQECGKQVANLPEHVRMVHRKEKNFKCSYCGYSCAKQSDMKKHSRNVHKVIV